MLEVCQFFGRMCYFHLQSGRVNHTWKEFIKKNRYELSYNSDVCETLVCKSTGSQEMGKNAKEKKENIIQNEETQDYNHWGQSRKRLHSK
jgi:NADH:ubiquinone oxidoreductase subunit E